MDPVFRFKQFDIRHRNSAMKVGVDGVLLGAWTRYQNLNWVLDIGCGTGLLSLMMAQRSLAQIVAIDNDEASVDEARLNFEKSPWANRLTLINASLQDFVSTNNRMFDLIICNPPFFNPNLNVKTTQRAHARFKDQLPLKEIFFAAHKMLHDDGRLSMIYPAMYEEEVLAESQLFGLKLNRKCYVKPKKNAAPNRLLLEFGKNKLPAEITEICIREKANYSDEYRELTSDFYLYLK